MSRIDNILGDDIAFVALVARSTLVDDATQLHPGDALSVMGARVSFNKQFTNDERDKGLVRFLVEHDHLSPLEHMHATFLLRVPLFVATHLRTHRTFHSNAESARFIEPKDEVYIPLKWRRVDPQNKQNSIGSVDDETNEALRKDLAEHWRESMRRYREAIEKGAARELARTLIPQSVYVSYVLTGDLRNLLHFVSLRAAGDAQWETRQVASAIFWLIRDLAPTVCQTWFGRVKPDVAYNLTEFYKKYHGGE